MGSGQSSTNHKDTSKNNKNTFAIDLDGKGDQPKSVKKQRKKKRKDSRKVKDPNQEEKMAAEASQQQQQQQQQHQHQEPAGFAPLAAMSEMSSGLPQLSTLSSMPRAQSKSEEESYSLQELDVMLERMRARYRPRPVVLSGKSRSVFEEFEQNLVNCYSKHKDQPLECSKISRDYAAFVSEQRNRILRDATRKDSPLFT